MGAKKKKSDDTTYSPVRVMRYGLLSPSTEHRVEVFRQFWLAHNYQNALVWAEQEKRAAKKVMKESGGWSKEIEDSFEERSKALCAMLKDLFAKRGLHWGTESVARCSAMQSRSSSGEPHRKRFRGEGTLRVQIQQQQKKGQNPDEFFKVLPQENAKKESYKTLRLRIVGKREARRQELESGIRPIEWVEFPMTLHRPIPPGVVKEVRVTLKKIGPREEWSVLFSVEQPDRDQLISSDARVVGVDLGWRYGTAAAWAGTDGAVGKICVAEEILNKFKKADELKSIRDGNFNVQKTALSAWLKVAAIPAWLEEKTRTLDKWRSIARLVRLYWLWDDNRFPGDASMFEELTTWRYNDDHLWRWETSQAKNAIRARREVYRIAACQLAKRYDVVTLENLNLSEAASSKKKRLNQGGRVRVAPSELRECLKSAFTRRGGAIIVEKANTTQTCNSCGCLQKKKLGRDDVARTCDSCLTWFDRDINAAKNIRDRGCERLGGGLVLRWRKSNAFAEMKRRKKEKMELNREPLAMCELTVQPSV